MTFKMTPEQLQEDRIVSAYMRAVVALDAAARAIKAPLPHNAGTEKVLKKARADLDWYLSELERARG